MSCRCWNHLDPKVVYTIRAANGWMLSMNGDGTVAMTYKGSQDGGPHDKDMDIDPDPGNGEVPPGK